MAQPQDLPPTTLPDATLLMDSARASFYTLYRRESADFDRDYAGEHNQNLDTALLFAGLFSAVSTTFISIIQPQLQPDPNDVTAAYMQLLVHTLNNTLFPQADTNSATSLPGPSSKIVVAQAILYASLATSLLAAFFATLGKQWINRYTQSQGGSIEEKSRKRQQKLDGLNDWYFHFVIECLPVMLQLALLLFGCALSIYLWTINNTLAWVMVAFILAGFALYAFFTTAAMFYPTCPYQTIVIQALARGTSAVCRSLRSEIAARNDRRRQSRNRGRNPGPPGDEESPPPPTVELDDYFGDISASPADRGDARCVSWVLDSAADDDVVFYSAWFTVEMTLYPEIAGILSPVVLANHFLSSALGGRAVSKRLERTSMIGMALASVLSIQLCMDPEREELLDLSKDLRHYTDWISSPEPTVSPGVAILGIVLKNRGESIKDWGILSNIPGRLPTSQKLCLSRTILQTVWRWRRDDPTTIFHLESMGAFCNRLMANGDHAIPALKTNCFLIMVICLGTSFGDVRKLFTPDTRDTLIAVINFFHRRLRESIGNKVTDSQTTASILSAVIPLDPFQVLGNAKQGFEWISDILESEYPENGRRLMTVQVMRMVEERLFPNDPNSPYLEQPTWIHSFLHFLSLFEGQQIRGSSTCLKSIARYILASSESTHFSAVILPLLTLTLSPTHPSQLRCSGLKAFYTIASEWFLQREVPDIDLQDLLQAVGDPFQFAPDPPFQSGQNHDSMMVIAALIEFSSTDRWRGCLTGSAFTTCEKLVSTPGGRKLFLECLSDAKWPEFLGTSRRINTAITHLREFGHQTTAEALIEWAQATHRLSGECGSPLSPMNPSTHSEGDGDQSTRPSSTTETILDNGFCQRN